MSQAMATDSWNHEGLMEEKQLRKQLVATVSKMQWSYAIFWTTSTRQQNVLEWNYGYYNGDIKTRKTTQPMEYKDDQIGLERSEQLRELYESLATGDGNQQNKRPNASLSPEDLTDSEWYYLVCMSFTFNPGQCLPGKAFANNQHFWLSNAQFADSKVFSRSLLAKSATVQTVVCFPFMGGVLELGSTELVLEDSTILQHIITSLLDFSHSVQSDNSETSSSSAQRDGEIVCPNLEDDIDLAMVLNSDSLMTDCPTSAENMPAVFPFAMEGYAPNSLLGLDTTIMDNVDDIHGLCEELILASPDVSSNDCCAEDSFFIEGLNGTSQACESQLNDDELSNGVYCSFNSSDYPPMSFMNSQGILTSINGDESLKNNMLDIFQEGNNSEVFSVELDNGGTHYTKTITRVLKNTKQARAMQCSGNSSLKSSFNLWTRASSVAKPPVSTPQKLLKKILMNSALKHGDQQLKTQEENLEHEKVSKQDGDDAYASHVLSERRRREKLNEKFMALRSLIPSLSKVDKASILADTIDYLKELERRIEELESGGQLDENVRERRKHLDVADRTSDNYGSKDVENGKQTCGNKRKADDIDETVAEHHWVLTKDGPSDVNVTIIDKEVLIEMNCPWRDCLMLEIVKSISSLQMDPLSIQTSTVDGVLSLTVKSKFRSSVITSPGMIKRSLKRVVSKC